MPAATPAPVAATAFSRRGAYGIVRHPIYTGTIVLLAAMPDMTAGRLFFAFLTTLYIVLAIPWEEATLVEQHGEVYLDYQRAVRWRILPGVF
jgi:protein-S-isoprenylcysteine O-methyltransferase Ste14